MDKKNIKRDLKVFVTVFVLLLGVSLTTKATLISLESYEDKVLGGWLGQMIGNVFGLPTEGHFINSPGPSSLTYYQSLPNHAIVDDDTFNDIVWLYALEKYGLDLTSQDLANEWKEQIQAGDMACANWIARLNIEKGIMPPLSGHPSYNPYSLYIDAQIEADIWGLVSPGMPDRGSSYASTMSELMAYSDGHYGARFIAAMYSLAFIEDDIPTIINRALEFIPSESRYYEVIKTAIDGYTEFPDNFKRARSKIIREYYKKDQTPSSGWVIADVNGAMVVLSLLYGEGDFDKTLALAVQLGLDNDCNAANAGGILGTVIGAKNIPDRWTIPLNNLYFNNGQRLRNVPYYLSITDIADRTVKIGLLNIEKNGGTVDITTGTLQLPSFKIEVPEYERPWTDDEVSSGLLGDFFNGWEIRDLGWDMSPGIIDNYEGRENVFNSHPLNASTPFAFVRTETLDKEVPEVLKIGATSFNGTHPAHASADWLLRVYVNDKLIFSQLINRQNGKVVWYDLEVSLADYIGQTVDIRVENAPNNWNFEAAYWAYLVIEPQSK